jgi:hypothetical protein
VAWAIGGGGAIMLGYALLAFRTWPQLAQEEAPILAEESAD